MFTWAYGLITCEKGPEIDFRMTKSNRCVASLQRTVRNKELSWGSKIRIYKTVIRPTMLYGSETWTLTKREETKIQIIEDVHNSWLCCFTNLQLQDVSSRGFSRDN